MLNKTEEELIALGANITANEIKQQPLLWQEAFVNYQKNEQRIKEFFAKIQTKTNQKIRVIFTGAGTSQYVGDTVTPYLMKKADTQRFEFVSVGTTDIVAAPTEYLLPKEVTILVSFARSGNSPESVATVKLANQLIKTIYHITITCAPDGQLAQAAQGDADNLLLLMPPLSNDKGFAMTSSFTCMALTSLLVFDQTSTAEKAEYVQSICALGEEVVQREAEFLALLPNNYTRIVYLGSGSLSGLTREAQLKVLELTAGKVATVFDSSLGFRHGPKSFVNDETIVLVFVNNDTYTRNYDNDILAEVAQDGIAAAVIGIGQNHAAQQTIFGTPFIFSEKELLLPDGYLALPDIMVAQTIALNSSIMVGNTPDTPSPTGTVNRVVQGVTIHEYH
ncbi:SIS domain-containing protein [Enterococcus caccae]|uniref:AgaS protein n=1 Tax=Enterococcus caccae ATCC BAA-1240 TaxID=1158612 RepID=R3W7X1_9ENTE|nr:SIS domain-containing protein [Enterococcus caccae]EOL43597.1 AgaS protein [Enterococcus caccae ATCC BAA-1240]EOT68003.1 AgaS protein [Enterococcus caccae ATCC BAA-1240]OJG28508.1 AgaS protein [Enterococcus caccae]